MKKFCCILLSLSLIFALMTVTAFADDEDDEAYSNYEIFFDGVFANDHMEIRAGDGSLFPAIYAMDVGQTSTFQMFKYTSLEDYHNLTNGTEIPVEVKSIGDDSIYTDSSTGETLDSSRVTVSGASVTANEAGVALVYVVYNTYESELAYIIITDSDDDEGSSQTPDADDGSASQDKDSVPKTGGNDFLPALYAALSLGLAGMIYFGRKRKSE